MDVYNKPVCCESVWDTTSYGLTFSRSYVQWGNGIERKNGVRLWTTE
ncbi:hypothetical protein GCWU000325_01494 [Alloprevotella tannerae ATCC 51259]|uniref:Uncharacterized protein n=1 Tax=Alloprevotella tannerae ATCC 51259 TaxID=626522 RepID=C9LGZ3_9BACT|nr:hypothetical protein GCWU000325_01494 [Alloprevotella tannerae ATCC 51259]